MSRSCYRAYTTSTNGSVDVVELPDVRVALAHHVLLRRLVLRPQTSMDLGLLLFPEARAHGAAAGLAAANRGYVSARRRASAPVIIASVELGTKGGFAAGHAQSSGYRCEEGFGSNTLFVLAPL